MYDPATPYLPSTLYQSPYNVNWGADLNYTDIFNARAARLKMIRDDKAWPVVKRYYADGNYAALIEDWFCTYDPRLSAKGLPTTVPLILFPRQVELIEQLQSCVANGQDLVVAKSRDMGVSVVTLAWATAEWLMNPGVKISFGSRKEELVDKIGQPDSLLEKVRAYLRFLPQELLPAGYSESKHARFMKIANPVNGAVISGEAGDNIGRGGRSTAYVCDEAAFLERPEKIDAALSQNTNSRIDVSTPNGPDNPFAAKWFDGDPDKIIKFPMHWTQDCRKTKEWYEGEKKRLNDPRVIAQELDLDFDTSGEESVVRAEWIQSSVALRQHLLANGQLPGKASGVAGCDVGGGLAENTYIPLWGPLVGSCVAWIDGDTTSTAHKFASLAQSDGVEVVKFDSVGVGIGVNSTMKRLPIASQGVNVGTSPTRNLWPDGRKSRDKFRNLKAEIWWMLRDKLRKTHDHWCWINDPTTGAPAPIEDLILLPDDDRELLKQIGIPGYKTLDSGKIQIESKDELKRRGVPSPDRAESLIIAMAPKQAQARIRRRGGVV